MSDKFNGAIYHIKNAPEGFKGAIYHVKWVDGQGSHNLGYYADPEALEEAWPIAEAGDFALVGSTDTIWAWDADQSEWVDTDKKGQVTSVNSKTGEVVLTALDVGAIPQYRTMPASSSVPQGSVVQYIGADTQNYKNGYFYEQFQSEVKTATGTQTTGSSLSSITVNALTFAQEMELTESTTIPFEYSSVIESIDDVYTNAGETEFSNVTVSAYQAILTACGRGYEEVLGFYYDETEGKWLVSNTISRKPKPANIFGRMTTAEIEATGITVVGTPTDADIIEIDIIGSQAWSYSGGTIYNMSDIGVSYSGEPESGDVITVVYTEGVSSAWVGIDVQPVRVRSVNGQIGDVTVQETLVSGTNIKTINGNSVLGSGNIEISGFLPYPSGWTTNSTTKAFCDSVAADTTATVGKAYLGEVTFSDLPASMANAEVNVYINDGTTAADKVIVLELASGNVAPYKWIYVYWDGGSSVSGWKTWQEPLVSGTNIKTINGSSVLGSGDITTEAIQLSTLPTASAEEAGNIYQFVGATGTYTNGYFYKCVHVSASATATSSNPDVTVSVDAQTFAGQVSGSGQYVFEYDAGTDAWYDSDSNPVNLADFGISKFGVSVSQDTITVDYVAESYDWQRTDVQPAPIIPDPLPDQTGNAGKFLTTDGTDASWGTVPSMPYTIYGTDSLTVGFQQSGYMFRTTVGGLGNDMPVGPSKLTVFGYGNTGLIAGSGVGNGSVIFGTGNKISQPDCIVVGNSNTATVSGCCIIGGGNGSRTITEKGFYWATYSADYKLLDSNGTIPTDRFTTTPVADGTYVPTLTIASGVATRTWSAPSGGATTPSTMPTLAVADWSSNTQTVTVSGVTASNIVFVSPAPASAADYASAGIVCTAQGTDSLTFTCATVPSNAITVNVVIMG